jgi:hypothetical protein
MPPLRIIDLHFGEREHAIGVYVVDTNDGLALFDCGPTSTLPALERGLAELGLELSDIATCAVAHPPRPLPAPRERSSSATPS